METAVLNQSVNSSAQYDRIQLVGKILLAGFGLSLIINFFLGGLFDIGYPFDTFFFKSESKYLDFYYPYTIAGDPYKDVRGEVFSEMNPFSMPEIVSGQAWEINYLGPIYFPFAYWVVLPFGFFPLEVGLFLFWIITALVFISMCYRHIRKEGGLFYTFIVAIFSYPLLFLLNRSNFEIVVFAFVYMFVFYYDKNKWVSSLFLAAAIAMKFLPFAYVLVQLSDRKYKQAIFSAGVAFLLNVVAYALYPGGLVNNIRAHLLNLQISSFFYILDGRNIAFNSSLSAGIKYVLLVLRPALDLQAVGLRVENITIWASIILLVFVVVLFTIAKMEYWEKVAIVTCVILLVPSSSSDYRLLLLYIPFFLWLNSSAKSWRDRMYGFLFGLLFIPKSYLHVPTYPEISISTFLNPLLMLIMIFAIAFGSLISQNQPEKDEVEYKAHTLKRKFVLLFFLLIVLVVFWPGMENKRKTISPNTVQELRLLAMRSERSADYSFAAGYYMQWTLLDTTTPENHLGLARVYLKMDRYWDSYQEYKKAALLSLKNSPSRLEAEVGLRMVSNDTICYMIKMKQFGWSRLIQDEYNDLFPDLPKTGSKKCSHN